jgi:hypothetical protein
VQLAHVLVPRKIREGAEIEAEADLDIPLREVVAVDAYSGARRTAFLAEAEQDSGLIPNTIPG